MNFHHDEIFGKFTILMWFSCRLKQVKVQSWNFNNIWHRKSLRKWVKLFFRVFRRRKNFLPQEKQLYLTSEKQRQKSFQLNLMRDNWKGEKYTTKKLFQGFRQLFTVLSVRRLFVCSTHHHFSTRRSSENKPKKKHSGMKMENENIFLSHSVSNVDGLKTDFSVTFLETFFDWNFFVFLLFFKLVQKLTNTRFTRFTYPWD